MFFLKKKNPLFFSLNSFMIDLPSTAGISYMWNFGSLLGLCLIIQIFTGLFLSMHYVPDFSLSFFSVDHICRDVWAGSVIRNVHMNCASFFFFFLYLHIFRGIYYQSYKYKETWNSGILIFICVMMTAFFGYVLPWGQMSLWGATVITSILSSLPYVGESLVMWIWGGFSVSGPTLSRFFVLHFFLPFLILGLVMIHLMLLHMTGSSSPLGMSSNMDKIHFSMYFIWKDLLGYLLFFYILMNICFFMPTVFADSENYIAANSLVTPVHIQPEWYFLFAYAILRSIPNKFLGVLGLIISILIFFLPSLKPWPHLSKSSSFSFYYQMIFWMFLMNFILLSWIGAQMVEFPFVLTGQISSLLYFLLFLVYLL